MYRHINLNIFILILYFANFLPYVQSNAKPSQQQRIIKNILGKVQEQKDLFKIFKVTNLDKPAINNVSLLFPIKGLQNILLSNDKNILIPHGNEQYNKDVRPKDKFMTI